MSVQFRPSVGPFIRIPNQRRHRHGALYTLITMPIMLVIWSFQLAFFLGKLLVMAVVVPVRYLHAEHVNSQNAAWVQAMQRHPSYQPDPDMTRSPR